MEQLIHRMQANTREADAILRSVFTNLSFPCMVRDKKLIATFRGEVENPIATFFKFSFSDGYQTIFQRGLHGWIDQKTGGDSLYLKGIHADLESMAGFQGGHKGASFPVNLRGKSFNVFVMDTERDDAGLVKAVYYNADYRFDLKKINGKWHARTIRAIEPEMINEEMAALVVEYINSTEG
jgi:hypothetical protein